MVNQFIHSPNPDHFNAVYRILRYLKGTLGKGLIFKKCGHLHVEAYTNADWVGSIVDRRSTSGYCKFVGGNLVTWRSKKQNVVAKNIAEAKFKVVARETRKAKNNLNWSSWGSTGSLAIGAFNALAGYRCLDQTLIGPQPGNRVPQLRREGYWMRESVFYTPRLDLNRFPDRLS
ncbi:putative mitochondrial protein [Vitis vinifera]|uniref:Putative mitochondrial protein n=1 Tax=Vitis vinifera TaxID=29760 RepID=A0A438ICN2_VITVI|nr:putative mitochondrial protein [Vitis vinifera]